MAPEGGVLTLRLAAPHLVSAAAGHGQAPPSQSASACATRRAGTSPPEPARVRQYDSRLSLLDYATTDPARFGAQRMPLGENVGILFVCFCLVTRIILHAPRCFFSSPMP